jgi:hypothetical protein
MIDKKLIPYRGVLKQIPVTTLDTTNSESLEVMPPELEEITTISQTPQNQKALPVELLQSVRILLELIKNPEEPLVIKQTRKEFENSPKFVNAFKDIRNNYRALDGIFNDNGLTSQLVLASGPAFNKKDKAEIAQFKPISESDKLRLSFFVDSIITIGEKFVGDNAQNFRKDPVMRALLSQIINRVNNPEQSNVEKQASESINVNEYIYDFDIDTYSIELLRIMQFVLSRFISVSNIKVAQNNNNQTKLDQ